MKNNVVLMVFLGFIAGGLFVFLTLSTMGDYIYLSKKEVNDFYVYDAEIVELSIRKEVETKYFKSPSLYKNVLQDKLDEAYSYLKYISEEKPLYALGARVGGQDITDDIIKKLGIEKAPEFKSKGKKVRENVPYPGQIEKMKRDIIKEVESSLNGSDHIDNRKYLP